MRLVVPVKLETFRLILGEHLFKNYRSPSGELRWIEEEGCVFIGDVGPHHQTLLAIGSLVREGCPEKKFSSRLKPLLKQMSPQLAELAMPVRNAGTCKIDGREAKLSPGAFGIADMKLTDEIKKELVVAAEKHFRDYKVLSETGRIRMPDPD